MTTFVLVHGAWHGGWCWQRVVPLIRAAGHEAYAPTLTGLGERAHLGDRPIGLDTHITDVVALMEMEDLADVVLVGHSYGGFVVTGVADRMASRLKTLVYLDAFVPQDGASLVSFVPEERRAEFDSAGKAKGVFDPFPVEDFGVTDPADVAWVTERQRPQPYGTFADPLKLAHGTPKVASVFIRCTDPAHPNFEPFAQRLRDAPGWKYLEVAGGHDVMITNPSGIADALAGLA